ncbi:MAG: class I SAM-dependent methyltransferase [Planctomycetota bacterium]|nr:class I SAM-dependent methyltransferase [Planctomycetota bacterium]
MDAKAWDAIAPTYFDEVISPFQKGVANPLFGRLDGLKRRERLVAGDLGCGIGNLLPFLAARFRGVWAVDFSAGMLRQARAKRPAPNVRYKRLSMLNLKPLHGRLDVAVAVNSVLSPHSRQVDRMLREIRRVLRPGGRFFGIFPSMESVLYHGHLLFDRELARTGSETRALRAAHRRFERRKYSFLSAVFTDCDGAQKLYYDFELYRRLKRAGFRAARLAKVRYPWDAVGGHEPFPGHAPMWDWFVEARAPRRAPEEAPGSVEASGLPDRRA